MSGSLGRASTCESRVGNDSRNKSAAGAAAASSSSSCSGSCFSSNYGSYFSSSNYGSYFSSSSYGSCSDDSEYEESLDASSSSAAASSYYRKTKTRHISRRPTTNADSDERWDADKKPATSPAAPAAAASASGNRTKARRPNNSRASPASAERWDAHKQLQPRAPPAPAELELDDGESSTGSNEVELDMPWRRQSLYAGPGFIKSPEPRMLPMPSPFMSRVSLVA